MIVEHGYQEPQPSTLDRFRLMVIGAVAVLAVGVGVVLGGVLVTGGAASLARAASYVPADAVMYTEARLDLPGSQRANLQTLLERFPAADPDAVLGDALADALDDALADATAPFDYSSDVAPWFDGTVALALLDYPLNADPANMTLPSMVGMFGVRDAAAAGQLLESLRSEAADQGSTFTSSQHAGVTIWTLEVEHDPAMPMQNVGFAYALADDQLLLANGAATIRSALDAEAGDSLADAGEVASLLEGLPEERAGTMVVNSAAMIEELRTELEAVQPGLAEAMAAYLDAVPPISVASVAFAEDAVLMDGASSLPQGPLAPANSQRDLAARVPADAIFFADGSGVGPALAQVVTSMKATLALGPMGEQQLAELEGVEDALGAELDEFFSWIGDGAMAAGWDGAAPYFGLVLGADDPEAAARRLNQLGALAELAADGGAQVEVAVETVDGVEVTRITYHDPASGDLGPLSEVALEYALDGDTALIGVGRGFVRSALTRDPTDSLAESERYVAAVGRFGGSDNSGTFYLDLTGLRVAVEGAVPELGTSAYAQDVRPNLEPLDMLAGVTRVDGDRVVSRLGLVLR